MDQVIYMQVIGIGLLVLSPIMFAKASSWARAVTPKQTTVLGFVHSEDFIRAGYRFGSLVALLFGLLLFSIIYFHPAIYYIVATIFASAAIFIIYSSLRFPVRHV